MLSSLISTMLGGNAEIQVNLNIFHLSSPAPYLMIIDDQFLSDQFFFMVKSCYFTLKFSTMCKNLRVLNAINEYKIGMPLTMAQFDHLTPKVVIDRLLQRRLFALASKMCQFMQIQG